MEIIGKSRKKFFFDEDETRNSWITKIVCILKKKTASDLEPLGLYKVSRKKAADFVINELSS